MSFRFAKALFATNFVMIGGNKAAATDPEKHNLYLGLLNLAKGLEDLERKLTEIKATNKRSSRG